MIWVPVVIGLAAGEISPASSAREGQQPVGHLRQPRATMLERPLPGGTCMRLARLSVEPAGGIALVLDLTQ